MFHYNKINGNLINATPWSKLLWVCLATNAKAVIFHSMYMFVWTLVRNLFCNDRYTLRQRCPIEFCVKLIKKYWTDKVVKSHWSCYRMCVEQKQWAGLQSFNNHRYSFLTQKTLFFCTAYFRSKLWMVFSKQIHSKLI
jgi:hypothetical protein